ncbi:MAG: DUF502 domain-containing protein [Bacteroidetes bacterium]|nr:DUF502 domain-containing protein [Bacteroidota bacterium]
MQNQTDKTETSPAKSTWQLLLSYFLRGLIVLLPIALTVGIIAWIGNAIGSLLHVDTVGYKHLAFYIIFTVIGILLVGFITKGVIAHQVLDFLNGIIEKAPGLKFIFGTTRDVTEAFVGEKKKFTEPVLVTFSDGIYKMGFVTQRNMDSMEMPEHITVYLPFCYSIAGEMLVVHKSKITPVKHDSSHVMKFVISGGVVGLEKGTR